MLGPFVRDRIENWASDFCVSDRLEAFPPPLREIAQEVLVTFLTAACDARSIEPGDITEADVRPALDAVAGRIALPVSCHADTPGLVGDFLAFLEDEGRLAGGRLCGAYARALKPGFSSAAAGKGQTYTNPGSRIGRNDPCPCGSGKKYKKCCMRE